MRRIPALLLVLALFFVFFAACAMPGAEEPAGMAIYFRLNRTDEETDSVIGPEIRTAAEETPAAAMGLLMKGPLDRETFSAVIPAEVTLEAFMLEDAVATVRFSAAYGDLEGVERSLADACVTGTLLQFDAVDRVVLTWTDGEGEEHTAAFGADSFEITRSRNETADYEVNLYFANGDGRSLTAERETLVAADERMLETYLAEALVKGPRSSSLKSALPAGTEILNLYTERGTCYVNFNDAFLRNMSPDLQENMTAVYAVVNSLTETEEIDRVQILVEGTALERYGEVPTAGPLTYDGTLVYREEGDLLDAEIWLRRDGADHVSPHFWQIERAEFATTEQLVADALLHAEMPAGYEDLFGDGVALRTIATRSGVCYVDLTSAFTRQDQEHILFGAHALAATLLNLSGVEGVEITCGGEPLTVNGLALPEVFTEDNVLT